MGRTPVFVLSSTRAGCSWAHFAQEDSCPSDNSAQTKQSVDILTSQHLRTSRGTVDGIRATPSRWSET